jgi:hypothetical protein
MAVNSINHDQHLSHALIFTRGGQAAVPLKSPDWLESFAFISVYLRTHVLSRVMDGACSGDLEIDFDTNTDHEGEAGELV